MREPISRDSASPRELAEATRRLDLALARLDAACAAKVGRPAAAADDDDALAALARDRARLAADLETARARERELEIAAAAASQALGRAAAEVRAALEDGGPVDPRLGDEETGEPERRAGEPIEGEAEAASKAVGDGLNEEAA